MGSALKTKIHNTVVLRHVLSQSKHDFGYTPVVSNPPQMKLDSFNMVVGSEMSIRNALLYMYIMETLPIVSL